MKYLLDTHTLIWFMEGDHQLSKSTKDVIEDTSNEKFVSIVSFWEMAIKISLQKLDLKKPIRKLITEVLETDIQVLPLSFNDILIVSQLPFHHRDPFDRIIIAQAITENLTVIGQDKHFEEYDISIFW